MSKDPSATRVPKLSVLSCGVCDKEGILRNALVKELLPCPTCFGAGLIVKYRR